MASLGHVAVGVAVARYADGRTGDPRGRLWRAMVFWSLLSILPDLDVIGFSLGVRYDDPWGHRGATHSLALALVAGGLALALAGRCGFRRVPAAILAAGVVASHGLLDAFTDGGLGVGFLWPVSNERFFAPVRPIPVAPIGLQFLSERGLHCAAVEAVLFLPLWVYAFWPRRRAQVASR